MNTFAVVPTSLLVRRRSLWTLARALVVSESIGVWGSGGVRLQRSLPVRGSPCPFEPAR